MDGQTAYLQVSRTALWENAKAIAQYVSVPVIGVVKCDGYGVSIAEAALAWQAAGVTMFAVSTPQEALALRSAGFQEDILLLCPVADHGTLLKLQENGIILTVTGMDAARFYQAYGAFLPLRVHVAVDTGMGRFGVRWTDPEQLKEIYTLPGLKIEGIFSHFSASFEKDFRQTRRQLQRFLDTTDALTSAGFSPGIRHIANSCAALRFPETRLDAVRIGSALVGKLCAEVPIPLLPVAQFKAQVVDCRLFHPGDTTGYASLCKIRRPTRAVIVAIGSDNGFGHQCRPEVFGLRSMLSCLRDFFRQIMRKPSVYFGSTPLPLIGRIGSQYTLFDAAGTDIRPGDFVTAHVPLLFPSHRRIVVSGE